MLASNTASSRVSTQPNSSRDVNRLLNNLRDEHIRHARNQQSRGRTLIYSPPRRRVGLNGGPSLPVAFGLEQLSTAESLSSEDDSPSTTKHQANSFGTIAQRAAALRLLIENVHPESTVGDATRIPPLVDQCLRILLANYAVEDILPYLDVYLRSALHRYAFIYAPGAARVLLNRLLTEGQDGGDFGGEAYVRGEQGDELDRILEHARRALEASNIVPIDATTENWDDDGPTDVVSISPIGLRILALIQTPLPNTAFFSLPRTLTHLALLAIPGPTPVPLHRIPELCPQLKFLDISYNAWLDMPQLERVRWENCSGLEVLAVRGSSGSWESVELSEMVNRRRLRAVLVIT